MQSAWLAKPYLTQPPCRHSAKVLGGGGASLTETSPETVGSRNSLGTAHSPGKVVRVRRSILSPVCPLSSTEIASPAMVESLGALANMLALFPSTLRQLTSNGPMLPNSPS